MKNEKWKIKTEIKIKKEGRMEYYERSSLYDHDRDGMNFNLG